MIPANFQCSTPCAVVIRNFPKFPVPAAEDLFRPRPQASLYHHCHPVWRRASGTSCGAAALRFGRLLPTTRAYSGSCEVRKMGLAAKPVPEQRLEHLRELFLRRSGRQGSQNIKVRGLYPIRSFHLIMVDPASHGDQIRQWNVSEIHSGIGRRPIGIRHSSGREDCAHIGRQLDGRRFKFRGGLGFGRLRVHCGRTECAGNHQREHHAAGSLPNEIPLERKVIDDRRLRQALQNPRIAQQTVPAPPLYLSGVVPITDPRNSVPGRMGLGRTCVLASSRANVNQKFRNHPPLHRHSRIRP